MMRVNKSNREKVFKIKFAISEVQYWNSIGFDVTNWRKSQDGIYAIAHYEYIAQLKTNIESDSNIKVVTYNTAELQEALLVGWGESAITLEDAKKQQEARIREACREEILDGYMSDAKGNVAVKYPFDEEAQRNLIGIKQDIILKQMNGGVFSGIIAWKNKSQIIADSDWTVDRFLKLCNDASAFKYERIHTCQLLVTQIINATTIAEVEAIVWTRIS